MVQVNNAGLLLSAPANKPHIKNRGNKRTNLIDKHTTVTAEPYRQLVRHGTEEYAGCRAGEVPNLSTHYRGDKREGTGRALVIMLR